jgi:ankyrin repeat protein
MRTVFNEDKFNESDNNTKLNSEGQTRLMVAAKNGSQDFFSLLGKANPILIKSKDTHGMNALTLAIIDPDDKDPLSKEGKIAAANKIAAVQHIINFMKPSDTNQKDAQSSYLSFINSTYTSQQTTALAYAAMYGKQEIVEILLENSADVNAKNKDEQTPLMLASAAGYADVAAKLLEHGADVNAKDKNGYTALDKAIVVGNEELVKLLSNYSASTSEITPSSSPSVSRTTSTESIPH